MIFGGSFLLTSTIMLRLYLTFANAIKQRIKILSESQIAVSMHHSFSFKVSRRYKLQIVGQVIVILLVVRLYGEIIHEL